MREKEKAGRGEAGRHCGEKTKQEETRGKKAGRPWREARGGLQAEKAELSSARRLCLPPQPTGHLLTLQREAQLGNGPSATSL